MFIPVARKLKRVQRYGAVSVLAIMAAGCASYAGDGQYRGGAVQHPPPGSYNGAYSTDYDAGLVRYDPAGGIEVARAAHRNNSAYRAEQLDGNCESRVSLKYGETLSDIAEFCDVSIASILAVNPQIRNQNRVSVAETILIPSARANIYADNQLDDRYGNIRYPANSVRKDAIVRDRGRDHYVVRRGDTLAAIAQRYEVSLNDIARLNPNLQPRRLAVGELVYLPENASNASNKGASARHAALHNNESPIISITPAHGPRNGEIRLVGDNFRRGEEVFILYGDSHDSLVRIRTIECDDAGRIDERVSLPDTYGRDNAYFAVQRGTDTYMSQSYVIDRGVPHYGGHSTGNSLSSDAGAGIPYSGPYLLTDPARLIAVDLDVDRGDAVNLVAHSFPPNTPVSIYVGKNRNSLVKVAETRTGPEGVFQTQVVVPANIIGDSVYFVATVENGARTYFSERVRLQDDRYRDAEKNRNWDRSSSRDDIQIPYRAATQAEPSSRTLDRGLNDKGRNVGLASRVRHSLRRDEAGVNAGAESAVSGVLTNEGVSCPTMRDDAGRLYTLLGDLQGFDEGDRVLISGSAAADRRICGQSETIQVFSIAKAPW